MTGDVSVFDRFARFYDLFAPRTDGEEVERALARADRSVERVLDVGGGPGRALASIDADGGVVVDAAPGMVAQARAKGREAVLADGARLPVKSDSVDAVVVTDALHHVGERVGLLSEAARVLRPGGVLVILDFDPSTVRGRLLVAAEHAVGFESVFTTPSELAEMVSSAGLAADVLRDGFGFTVVGVAQGTRGDGANAVATA